jgi:dipeptide transport system ATP-binding protein
MSQRVMVAMAIACNPRLLIADEPTTALDVTIQAQMLALLLKLQRERGMALMLITQDRGVVAEVAQRVKVMYAASGRDRPRAPRSSTRRTTPYTEALPTALPDTYIGHAACDRCRAWYPRAPTTARTAACCRPRCPYVQRSAARATAAVSGPRRAGALPSSRC